MQTIDKGEKHEFKRRLLDSSDTAIAWSSIDSLTIELTQPGEKAIKTWTKADGDITESGEFVRFELDSTNLATGTYYLKVTLGATDAKWANNTANEITWDTEKVVITLNPNSFNLSRSSSDLKFDIS